jgi:hypothetical protein
MWIALSSVTVISVDVRPKLPGQRRPPKVKRLQFGGTRLLRNGALGGHLPGKERGGQAKMPGLRSGNSRQRHVCCLSYGRQITYTVKVGSGLLLPRFAVARQPFGV